ncbi:MAG: ketoacyl-ACP synthase III [Elusimicrobia bacterium]|nr:ketoacyl-ACP synthase III [Elusimicrobiota bacterium]
MSVPFQILGMGWSLPKNELDNDFLRGDVGLERDEKWNRSRLGIQKRYSVLSKEYIRKTKNADPNVAIEHARSLGETPVTLGAAAAKSALAKAGVKPQQVGLVIANCDTPFETIPSTANLVAKALGIGPGPHMDVNSACSSFSRHMLVLGDMNEKAWPEFVLTVQASAYTTRTDYSPKSIDGYIWGDGAAAQVCSLRHQGRFQVEPMIFATDPAGANDITIDAAGHFEQNGAAVREFSIRRTCEMYEQIAKAKKLYAEDVYTVSHQANYVMQDSIIGHLHLPPEKHLRNVHLQGNIAAAGAPSVIAQNEAKFKSGDQIVYAVLGSGLAWGGGYMEVQ